MWRNLKELGESDAEVGNRSDEDMEEVNSDPEDDVPLASLQTTQRPATPVGLNHNGPDTAKPLDFCFLGCSSHNLFYVTAAD